MQENDITGLEITEMINPEQAKLIFEKTKDFMLMMTQYKCAMLEVKTKLDVLNEEMSLESERNPFESISCRIKKPISIVEKMKRKGLEITTKEIYENINDVAGIRVICSYPDDIYVSGKAMRSR